MPVAVARGGFDVLVDITGNSQMNEAVRATYLPGNVIIKPHSAAGLIEGLREAGQRLPQQGRLFISGSLPGTDFTRDQLREVNQQMEAFTTRGTQVTAGSTLPKGTVLAAASGDKLVADFPSSDPAVDLWGEKGKPTRPAPREVDF